VAAVALLIVAVGGVMAAIFSSGGRARADDAVLVDAVARSSAAGTARLVITESDGKVPGPTFSGIVDFTHHAWEARLSSGYRIIAIGSTSWHIWPAGGTPRWVRNAPSKLPTAGEQQLADALEPDTVFSALFAALKAGTTKVDEVSPGHYRAMVGSSWSTDVWESEGRLSKVAIITPIGTSTFFYSDFGVPVHITAPKS
jgi:hypothetical protein